jgi:hypothetical protein
MFKKILLVASLLFAFSCEDNVVEEESTMKLWLNGEEIDVTANYEKITTFAVTSISSPFSHNFIVDSSSTTLSSQLNAKSKDATNKIFLNIFFLPKI